MKKFALFTIALTLLAVVWTAAQADPLAPGTKATIKVAGKAVLKVDVKEGVNQVRLPSGKQLRFQIKDGKLVGTLDAQGKLTPVRGITPATCPPHNTEFCLPFFGCYCLGDIF
jgi:hypothetical protein